MNKYVDKIFSTSEYIRSNISIPPFIFALFSVSIGIIARTVLLPFFGNNSPLVVFVIALLLTGWYGGFFPVLAASLISVIVSYVYFIDPMGALTYKGHDEVIRLSIFLLSGILIGLISESRLRHEKKIESLLKSEISAKRKAEKSLSIRDNFLSIASHELKTPITAINLHLYAARKAIQNEKKSKYDRHIKNVQLQIEKLVSLIDDLLDVSKIQSGKLKISKENTNINQLTREVVQVMRVTSQDYKITLKGNIKNNILCDRDRISQVLTNLLSNAIKYSPKKKKVDVILTEDKENIGVSVRDFGIGIKKSDQKMIFKRFYRVEGEEEKTFKGFGLGLYICSEVIKQHKGKIWVESTRGKGSTFHFTLPKK